MRWDAQDYMTLGLLETVNFIFSYSKDYGFYSTARKDYKKSRKSFFKRRNDTKLKRTIKIK